MEREGYLFDIENFPTAEAPKKFRGIDTPLWTKNKALFIARYLKTFTFVTKHGTYIDAFAGPQHEESRETTWAAKLVLENEPAWLRSFHLFDEDAQQINHLHGLKKHHFAENPDLQGKRVVNVTHGDCNEKLPAFLSANPIRDREATFCLLDQRSTECSWETVKKVAAHKDRSGINKIEIFYFLAQGWIDRTIKSWRNDVEERCVRWWGKNDVMDFLKLRSYDRGRLLADRFKDELGYRHSYPFPIQKEGDRGAIMFWMVHASDHDRAPDLMHQAYRHIGAGGGLDAPIEQTEFEFD